MPIPTPPAQTSDHTVMQAWLYVLATVSAGILAFFTAIRQGWITMTGAVKVAEIQSEDKDKELDEKRRDALNHDLQNAIDKYESMAKTSLGMVSEIRKEMVERTNEMGAEIKELKAEVAQLKTERAQDRKEKREALEEARLATIGAQTANERADLLREELNSIKSDLKHAGETIDVLRQ